MAGGIFAANISTAGAYIADVTAPEERAKGMGIIGASFGLGFIFGPAIGGIFSVYGYSVPILIAAALGLANFFFAFFVLAESSEHREPFEKKLSLKGLRAAFAEKATSIPIVLFFLNVLAFTQLEVVFGLYVLARFGYEARTAGWLLAGIGVVSAILQGGLIGRLAKRFGEKNLLPFGFLLMAIPLAAAGLASTPAGFIASLFFLAIGNGLVNPSLSSLVSKGAPTARRGSVMGIYQSAGSLSRVIGPPIAGLLFDQVDPSTPLLVSSAIMGLALFGTLASRKKLA
jgi:MFS family permease